jgi:hypothetical protein
MTYSGKFNRVGFQSTETDPNQVFPPPAVFHWCRLDRGSRADRFPGTHPETRRIRGAWACERCPVDRRATGPTTPPGFVFHRNAWRADFMPCDGRCRARSQPGRYMRRDAYLTVGRLTASGYRRMTQYGEVAPTAAVVLPPLRRPVVYVLDETRRPVAVIDSYEAVEVTENWYSPDEFVLFVSRYAAGADELETGRFVAVRFPGDVANAVVWVGLIEGRELGVNRDGVASEVMTVTGRDYGSTLEGRLALFETAEGDGYDTFTGSAAEAMAYYVRRNALDELNRNRLVPYLEIGDVPVTPVQVAYRARFQSMTEILADIGQTTGLGWGVTFDATARVFRFSPRVGRDRTASIIFSPDYGNVSTISFSHSTTRTRTIACVAGQGEGPDRIWQLNYRADDWPAGAPEGLARREVFVDARDAETSSQLGDRAGARLGDLRDEEAVEFALLDGGSYEYPADFRLGDVVRADYPGFAYEEARVIGVRQRWDENGRTVAVSVGCEAPDLPRVVVAATRRREVVNRV